MPEFIAIQSHQTDQIAVSIDIRNMPSNPEDIQKILASLPSEIEVNLFFLDADDFELVKRFSETRRLHPLSCNKLSLEQAIQKEEALLNPLKERADKIINTSKLSIHDLSETIRSLILGKRSRALVMTFESFGFKHGLPQDADFVFDVRFLPNPHWDIALRSLTGLDNPVKLFFAQEPEVTLMISKIKEFLKSWLPSLEKNNRSYLTVAIGCTGGQHRSVYIAQYLADFFGASGKQVQVRHCTLEEQT